ncbi:MAG: amino acid ABC transporter substrate-binding protein [Pseudomonadota bacterium]
MGIRDFAAAAALIVLVAPQAHASPTLEGVKARGALNCGINPGRVGFAFNNTPDDETAWQGFDIAICRALAAAVLNDAAAVNYVPLNGEERFDALSGGKVDLLSRNTTWTLSRDAGLDFTFNAITYYDGQGFMVPKSLGVSSVLELDGATVCVQNGTTTALNLEDYFRTKRMSFTAVPVSTDTGAKERYLAEDCVAYTTEVSGLAALRAAFPYPSDHIILPEVIAKEPLGPLVRHGDEEWADIVTWLVHALIVAEEKGITQDNVDEMAQDDLKDLETARLLGVEGGFGALLGLEDDWAVRAIGAVGNYGEIFERHLGQDSEIGLGRGLNALYTDGGILYAPPFR